MQQLHGRANKYYNMVVSQYETYRTMPKEQRKRKFWDCILALLKQKPHENLNLFYFYYSYELQCLKVPM